MQRWFQIPQGSVIPSHETVGSQDSKRIFFTTEASISHGPNRSPPQVIEAVIRVVKELTCDVHGHAVEGEIPTAQIFAQRGTPVHLFRSSPVPVERFCTQRGDLKMAIVSFDRDRAKIHACRDGAVAKKGE